MKPISLLICYIFTYAVIAAAVTAIIIDKKSDEPISSSVTIQLQRPRQFLMDIYTRPFRKGLVQHVRADSNVTPHPCWNLASKHVSSISVNDPFVKIIFYRSLDCLGSSSTTIQGSETIPGKRRLVLKARSVSITKMRPILLLDVTKEGINIMHIYSDQLGTISSPFVLPSSFLATRK